MSLYDIIESLIDVSSVPPEKQTDPDYERARNRIHAELTSAKDVEIASYHEAGHWVQAVSVTNDLGLDKSRFTVVGPRIEYKQGEYIPTATGLKMHGMEDWQPVCEDDVRIIARIGVAGGESVRCFYGEIENVGDAYDKGVFETFCIATRQKTGGQIIQLSHKQYWSEARREVQLEFQKEPVKNDIHMKAKSIMRDVFGPVFSI